MSAEFCINITDDNELEEDETFNLTINTDLLHPEIIPMDPDQATVTILDDECKHLNYYYLSSHLAHFVIV